VRHLTSADTVSAISGMCEELLFVDSAPAAPRTRTFVFEMDGAQLFEASTGLDAVEFADSVICSQGFRGSPEGRAALAASLSAMLISRFTEDSVFAARIGEAEDPRPEMRALIRDWRRTLATGGQVGLGIKPGLGTPC
jgi:hypothetical protein